MQSTSPGSRSLQADQPPHAATTVELSELKGILVHRRMMIFGTSALLTIAILIYGLLTPSLFSSTAQIIIDPRDRQVVSNDVNPSSISPDGGITQVESQVSVAQSTGVLLRAIKATDLTKDKEFNSEGLLGRLAAMFGDAGSGTGIDDAMVKTIDALRRNLSVKRADKVLVIDVTVTAKNAEKASLLANAIAKAYLDDQTDARAQAARQASEGLNARLAEQRKQVENAENAVERYKSANNMVMASGKLVSDQVLSDLNGQLAVAQNRTSALKAQVDQIRKQRQGGNSSEATAEVMQSDVISRLREQEGRLGERASDLEVQLGPRHPSLITVRSQQRGLRALIDKELDRIAISADTDYERALANEKTLSERVATLEQQSLSTDQASVRLRELQRDLEAVRSIYANYLTRSQETREQIGIDSTNARIISQALPAQKRKWPPLMLLLAGAVFGGLGLGAGFALIAEYTSPTVLSEAQISEATGIAVLGVIPAEAGRRRFARRRIGKAPPDSATSRDVIPSTRLNGTIGLALRQLSDTGRWQATARTAPSILLTSRLEDGYERVRITALLAATAAARGDRVLLVDANVVEGGESDELGLLDVLNGECTLKQAIKRRYGGSIAYLSTGRQNPAVREGSHRHYARDMLIDARSMFDLVVVDGGELTENLKIAPLVSEVNDIILVAELKSTPLRSAVATAQAAAIMGKPPTAALLVDAAMRG